MELFAEISVLFVIATAIAVLMRLLHQPLIIGHILTGLIVGPFFFNLVHSTETLALMSQIGVAILLFTVGLHLSPSVLKQFGRVSLVTGIGQVVVTSFAGYLVCVWLGFGLVPAVYIAVALAFSSTIIITKLISDKGELDVLYAKIAIGFLLVQDLIVILLLLGIPLFATEHASWLSAGQFLLTAAVLVGFVALTARIFVSKALSFLAQSQELLFLFSIAWGIGVAALFNQFGLSLESGALIAGVALASLPTRREISARLSPLRDFFIVAFFIFLGSQLQLEDITAVLPMALMLSILVLIGNPLILMALMGYLGYRKKTSFQTGLVTAQISEFSLIFIALGVSLGHLDSQVLSLVTLVGLITIFGSTYFILHSDALYRLFAPLLGIFERRGAHEPRPRRGGYEIILFGSNRIGYDFIETLVRFDTQFLVIDHNPEAVARLQHAGIATEYGDASDLAFLESLDFSKTELVISTIPDAEVNALIHATVKNQNPEAVVLVVAHRVKDALAHYDEGVDYVILPHFLGSKHAAEIVVRFKADRAKYKSLREEHIDHLQLRLKIGHEHPYPESLRGM